ncbi:hypothetical protein BJ170DRAFT_324833 [Xylariales sp. AK1849]|nr:hypothetical protein BJ170DRAFT_324833 [Xylariales sp. AK1849]
MMPSYQYLPLPSNGSCIRLLRLLPSQDKAAVIKCEIFHASLEDEDRQLYQALSYSWGDTSRTVDIELSGCTFAATINLEAALRALRYPDKPRVMWVDAVCINQINLQEQGEQVSIMWHIYKAADCVVVWLGPQEGDSAIAMKSFAQRETQTRLKARKTFRQRPAGHQGATWCGCHAGNTETDPPRIGVQKLLGRNWFSRVWVLQEVAVAKRVVVACGAHIVDGQEFYREILGVTSWYSSLAKTMRKVRSAVEIMDRTASGLEAGTTPLLELIERFRGWQATNPLDKVYALLSLSSDACDADTLRPDYSISEATLARRVLQHALPRGVIEHSQEDTANVTFEIEGFVIGKLISDVSTAGSRAFQFSANEDELPGRVLSGSRAREIFKDKWKFIILNERKLRIGGLVVLLRGSSRPSILRRTDGEWVVEMIATPEPVKEVRGEDGRYIQERSWITAVKALEQETEDAMIFKLSWNPIRMPHPWEVSRYAPSPNNVETQWEAFLESRRDAKAADPNANEHNCHTSVVAWHMFHSMEEKAKIKAGTSEHTITLQDTALAGYLGVAKLLIDANADVNATDEKGFTALQLAALKNRKIVAKTLLDAGAVVDTQHKEGMTALSMAAEYNFSDTCQLLLDAGADVNTRDYRQGTPLMTVAAKGYLDTVKVLLKGGADPNAMSEAMRVTAIHMAAEMGNEEIVEALIQACAEVNVRTITNTTPLHQAAMKGHLQVVEILLGAGAEINTLDDQGLTPLDFAVYCNHEETAQHLWEAGGLQVFTALEEGGKADEGQQEDVKYEE